MRASSVYETATPLLKRTLSTGQPPNDMCSSAQVLSPRQDLTPVVMGSTSQATVFNLPCASPDTPTVFYQFVGNDARVRLSTCGSNTNYNSALSIDGGTTCGASGLFCGSSAPKGVVDTACDMSGRAVSVEFFTRPGVLYLVAVHSRDNQGSGNFDLSFLEYNTPTNNDCSSATIISPSNGPEPVVFGSTLNATVNTFACRSNEPSVFYQFVGTGEMVRLSTCSDVLDFNSNIVVDTRGRTCGDNGVFCSPPTPQLDLACDPSGQAVFVEFETQANRLYLVAINSRDDGGTGNFGLSFQAPGFGSPPSPTNSPTVSPPVVQTIPPTLSPIVTTAMPSSSPGHARPC